jgi:hypothetical protein
VDPQLSPTTLGGRPRRSVAEALATVEHLARRDGQWTLVTLDVRQAFDSLPHDGVVAVVRKWLGDTPLADLVERIVRSGRDEGVAQGGALSPLVLNLYLHEHLDAPWRRAHPDRPLIRWVDDVLILAKGGGEGRDALAEATRMLADAGLEVKSSPHPPVSELAAGATATWLGFAIGQEGNEPDITITNNAWANLHQRVQNAGRRAEADPNPAEIARGWVQHVGPALGQSRKEVTAARIQAELTRTGREQIPLSAIMEWCRRSRDWYEKVRGEVSKISKPTERDHPQDVGDTRVGDAERAAPPARIQATIVPPPASTPDAPGGSANPDPPTRRHSPARVDHDTHTRCVLECAEIPPVRVRHSPVSLPSDGVGRRSTRPAVYPGDGTRGARSPPPHAD